MADWESQIKEAAKLDVGYKKNVCILLPSATKLGIKLYSLIKIL